MSRNESILQTISNNIRMSFERAFMVDLRPLNRLSRVIIPCRKIEPIKGLIIGSDLLVKSCSWVE